MQTMPFTVINAVFVFIFFLNATRWTTDFDKRSNFRSRFGSRSYNFVKKGKKCIEMLMLRYGSRQISNLNLYMALLPWTQFMASIEPKLFGFVVVFFNASLLNLFAFLITTRLWIKTKQKQKIVKLELQLLSIDNNLK